MSRLAAALTFALGVVAGFGATFRSPETPRAEVVASPEAAPRESRDDASERADPSTSRAAVDAGATAVTLGAAIETISEPKPPTGTGWIRGTVRMADGAPAADVPIEARLDFPGRRTRARRSWRGRGGSR